MVFRWSLASEAVYPVERLACRVIRAVRVRVAGAFAGASVAAENDRLRREAEALSMVRGDLERLRAENVRPIRSGCRSGWSASAAGFSRGCSCRSRSGC